MDWMDNALCKNLHTDLFYPPLEAKDPNDYYRVSKAICYTCPVWSQCLDEALKHSDKWGCWGGLNPQERKSPKKIPHGTKERYRTGCTCEACTNAHNTIATEINLEKVPKSGQHCDITDILFKLHRNGD